MVARGRRRGARRRTWALAGVVGVAAALVAALAWVRVRGGRDDLLAAHDAACAALAGGDLDGAVRWSELAVAVLPGSATTQSLAGGARAAAGDLQRASERFEEAARDDPRDAESALSAGLVARAAARGGDAHAQARAARWLDEAVARADTAAARQPAELVPRAVACIALLAAGDVHGADERLRGLESADPSEREQLAVLRAAVLARGGAWDDAERGLRAALPPDASPAAAGALARLGVLHGAAVEPLAVRGLRAARRGETGAVIDPLRRWLVDHPGDATALRALAGALAALGRRSDACAVREDLQQRCEGGAPEAFFWGHFLLAGGRPGEALPCFERAQTTLPGAPPPLAALLHAARGLALSRTGDAADADRAYQAAVALDAANEDAVRGLVTLRLDDGRADEAAAFAEAAWKQRPASAVLALLVARCRQTRGDPAGAEAAYRDVLRLDAGCAAAHAGLGRVLLARPGREGASAAFEAAIRADSACVDGWLGLLSCAGPRAAGFEARVAALVEQRPRDAVLWFVRGAAAETLGALDRAEAAYRRAVALDPGLVPAANNLAWLLAERLQRPEEAHAWAESARAAAPHAAQVLDTAGWIRFLLGDTQGAAADLDRAAKALPSHPGIAARRARVHAALGRAAETRR